MDAIPSHKKNFSTYQLCIIGFKSGYLICITLRITFRPQLFIKREGGLSIMKSNDNTISIINRNSINQLDSTHSAVSAYNFQIESGSILNFHCFWELVIFKDIS